MAIEILVGAAVVTSDGHELGHVKKVEPSAFHVDAPMKFDYWLQSTLVHSADNDKVTLTVPEAEIGGYKMDNPFDHNEFRANVPDRLKSSSVRDSLLQ